MTYLAYQERLQAIEADLESKQKPYELAAEAAHRTEREFELRLAQGKVASKAATETAKKDQTLVAIAAADDDLYKRYTDAQASYAALKAANKVLETRAMIGMSLLRAQQRETGG